MTWIDRVLNSDAGRGSPELAREIIEAAGGQIPAPRPEPEVEDD